MSKGSKNQTTTTTNAPPSYIAPYLQDAAKQASNLYQNGPALSADTQNANQMIRNRALNGSDTIDNAQNYVNSSLNGGFMGQNPYLDATFNRAAGAVGNSVQSMFGQAGRNVRGADATGLATDKLNDLASQIYGGAYEGDRNRQQDSLAYVSPLANQDYVDASQLQGVGQQMGPAANLDDYISRIGGLSNGYGTSTSNTPTQRNAMAGAASGAAMGSMLGPWGTLGGAVLGGIFGG